MLNFTIRKYNGLFDKVSFESAEVDLQPRRLAVLLAIAAATQNRKEDPVIERAINKVVSAINETRLVDFETYRRCAQCFRDKVQQIHKAPALILMRDVSSEAFAYAGVDREQLSIGTADIIEFNQMMSTEVEKILEESSK